LGGKKTGFEGQHQSKKDVFLDGLFDHDDGKGQNCHCYEIGFYFVD
jgi:hypothetical protein